MPNFGKPDASGRSSGKLTGERKKLRQPPKGEPFVWLTRELLTSPAWRAMSPNAARLIDFLLVEHTNHAGTENGNLLATYDQLAVSCNSSACLLEVIDSHGPADGQRAIC